MVLSSMTRNASLKSATVMVVPIAGSMLSDIMLSLATIKIGSDMMR
jgi:hypothetical protein